MVVVASLEQLVDGTLTFKAPKTKAGRRLIAMPDALIAILRAHRLEHLQLRLKLGLGKLPMMPSCSPISRATLVAQGRMFADKLGIGRVVSRSPPHPGKPTA
jgi:hypothetical protein